MPQIALHDVSIAYTSHHLLDGVSCRIEPGESIGLLGRNGAGKTTLMRMLAGAEAPDHGSVELAAGTRVALLPQDVPPGISGTIHDVVAGGLAEAQRDHEHEWEQSRRIDRTLGDMQLDPNADFGSLSTGMQRRVLLARALVGKPDVLLLDEPTNHLDIDAIEWLEQFFSRWPGTLLFVTHDRAFLTKIAKRILEIDRGRLFDWECDYATFLVRKEEALAVEEKQNALFDKRLAQEEAWIRQGIKARRTRNEGRVRALKELRNQRQARRERIGLASLDIDAGDRSGALVLKADDAAFGYDGRPIIAGVTTTVMRGDKVGLIGPNGAGKSTLLKGLLAQLPPLAGSVRQGTNLQVAYFDQTRAQLDPEQTAEENVGGGKSSVTIGGRDKHVIGYLQDFLFSPLEARSKIRYFSGGQRNRLLLAKLFASPANLLVLDEPTNDLDSETLELLEARLVAYEGTVLLVSHDREFLNNVVGSVLAIERGEVREYVGGYDDWVRQRPADWNAERVAGDERSESPGIATGGSAALRSQPPQTSAKTAPPKKLSYKDQRELAALPARIEKLESEIEQLHAEMAAPEFYKQPSEVMTERQAAERRLAAELAAAYARWEELEGA
ncbi:MAG: ATP-binding cassette domain-containing protein [Planctomycetales bacterium]|nr:ATP-binding cassette domain-containing protein [Planctomycetales bacterium]